MGALSQHSSFDPRAQPVDRLTLSVISNIKIMPAASPIPARQTENVGLKPNALHGHQDLQSRKRV